MNFRSKRWIPFFALLGMLSTGERSQALILFNLDNSANQSDPSTGVPWDAVGKVTNSAGTAIQGSVVYLGGSYVLTANHVTVDGANNHVTFDGTNLFSIDMTFFSGSPSQQVAANVDLKILKLTSAPPVSAVNILTTAVENTSAATVIGWGVGRNATPTGTASVGWGTDATAAKRWGVNGPEASATVGYQSGSYDALVTVAGGYNDLGGTYSPEGLGDAEAALTLYDSGSGLFQNIAGTWYLIGVGTSVETNGTSLFGNDNGVGLGIPGSDNYFVRISSYDAQILSAIPEPSTYMLLAWAMTVLGWIHWRRNGAVSSDPNGQLNANK